MHACLCSDLAHAHSGGGGKLAKTCPCTGEVYQDCDSAPCDQLASVQAIYVVHPSAAVRAWILALRLRLPEIYGKVVYVDRLSSLDKYIASDELVDVPDHVREKDAALDRR